MPRLLPDITDINSIWKLFTVVLVLVTAYICHFNGVDLSQIDNCIGDPTADEDNPVLTVEQEAQTPALVLDVRTTYMTRYLAPDVFSKLIHRGRQGWVQDPGYKPKDWDRQSPTQIVTEMCRFVAILSGTFLLHRTKDMTDGPAPLPASTRITFTNIVPAHCWSTSRSIFCR